MVIFASVAVIKFKCMEYLKQKLPIGKRLAPQCIEKGDIVDREEMKFYYVFNIAAAVVAIEPRQKLKLKSKNCAHV